MNYLPSQELFDVLEPAYAPCPGFSDKCRGVARWCPAEGHFPRGFIGAFGDLDEVQVVIVVAEPGDPFSSDRSGHDVSPRELMAQTCRATFENYDAGKNLFHRNVRFLLNRILGVMPLEKQLVRTWITESMLCSAPVETGIVPFKVTRECGERYLAKQLVLLNRCPIVALGGKAQQRVKYSEECRSRLVGKGDRCLCCRAARMQSQTRSTFVGGCREKSPGQARQRRVKY